MRSNLLALLCMALAMMAHGLPTPGDDDNQVVENSKQHVDIPHVRIGTVGIRRPGEEGGSQHIQLAE